MTDTAIAVTIGFPVYNVERYVDKALLSALEQDFQYPYEILVVDDCCTDRSMDIVRHLAATHPHGDIIRIITHNVNLGLGQVRNTIIQNAKGRYLFFLDSDDWMEKCALSILYNKAIETGAEITAGSSMYFQDDGLVAEYKVYPDVFVKHCYAGVYLLSSLHIDLRGETWAKLWSLDFIKNHSIEFTSRIIEDFVPDFVSRVESSSLCLVHDVVYHYYFMRNDSIMSSVQTQLMKDRTTTWVNNLKSIQALVTDKYSEIPGIFDLYLTKLRNCYRRILKAQLDKEQTVLIDKQIRGCISIIPSARSILNRNNKLMYLLLRKNDSLERFSIYDRLLEIFVRIVRTAKRSLSSLNQQET